MDLKLQKQLLDLVKQHKPDDVSIKDFVDDLIRQPAIDEVNEQIKRCNICQCSQNGCRSQTFGDAAKASILVIGDFVLKDQLETAVDEDGVKTVFPYQGTEEWELLQKAFTGYHVKPEALFWVNAVQCLPQDTVGRHKLNRVPGVQEAAECKVYTDYIIRNLEPLYIILLGNTALNQYKHASIESVHGEEFEINGIPAMPLYNPSTILDIVATGDEEAIDEYKGDFSEDLYQALRHFWDMYPDDWEQVFTEELPD